MEHLPNLGILVVHERGEALLADQSSLPLQLREREVLSVVPRIPLKGP
jgi:hypothetical protein